MAEYSVQKTRNFLEGSRPYILAQVDFDGLFRHGALGAYLQASFEAGDVEAKAKVFGDYVRSLHKNKFVSGLYVVDMMDRQAVFTPEIWDQIDTHLDVKSLLLHDAKVAFADPQGSVSLKLNLLEGLGRYVYSGLGALGQDEYSGYLAQAHENGYITSDVYVNAFHNLYISRHPVADTTVQMFLTQMSDKRAYAGVNDFDVVRRHAIYLVQMAEDSELAYSLQTRQLAAKVGRRFLVDKMGYLRDDDYRRGLPAFLGRGKKVRRIARVIAQRLELETQYSGVDMNDLSKAVIIAGYLPAKDGEDWLKAQINRTFDGYKREPHTINRFVLSEMFNVLKNLRDDIAAPYFADFQGAVVTAFVTKNLGKADFTVFTRRGIELLPRNERFNTCFMYMDNLVGDAAAQLDFAILARRYAQTDVQRAAALEAALKTGLLVKDTPKHLVGAVQNMFRRQADPVRVLDGGVTVWNGVRTPCFAQETAEKGNPHVRFYAIAGSLRDVQAEVEKRYTPIHPRRQQFAEFKQVLG